ncbi:MAG: glycosyltransferase family 4 protein, partial [Acidobacteriota bacterium]
MKIGLPVVQNFSGADRYFERLASGLNQLGYNASLIFYPHALEFACWLLKYAFRRPLDFDIIHTKAEYGFAFDVGSTPLVLTLAHSVFDPVYSNYKSKPQQAYHQYVLRPNILKSLAQATRVVTVSEFSRQRIAEDFGYPHARVVYNGVDENQFRPLPARNGNGRKQVRLLFTGNLIRRKGADILPEVMRRLGKDYLLYYTCGLRTKSAAPPCENMKPLGRLNDVDLVQAYNDCDIFLFPSRLEGFGYPVAEAMACAKPVVTTDCASMPELIDEGRGGYRCEVDN